MYIGPVLKMFHYFNNHHIIIPIGSLIQFRLMNFIQYHIIVYVVILHIFYYFRAEFNKPNVGILIKFTIADQIHDIFINVTDNQHKTIFFRCKHIR